MATTDRPGLDDLLAAVSVVQIPMRVRFRGVIAREAVLLRGPGRVGRVLAVPRVRRRRVGALAGGRGGVGVDRLAGRRCAVPCRSTRRCPRCPRRRWRGCCARYDGCATAKVKVAERGQALRRRRRAGGGGPRRHGAGRAGPGRRQRRLGRRRGERGAAAARGLGPGVRRAAVRHRRGAGGVARRPRPARGRPAGGRRRVDPQGVRPDAGGARGGRRHRRGQGRPARRGRLGARDRRASAGCRRSVSSALDTSVGIAAGVALAAALPELPYACGLSTVELMAGDVCYALAGPGGWRDRGDGCGR